MPSEPKAANFHELLNEPKAATSHKVPNEPKAANSHIVQRLYSHTVTSMEGLKSLESQAAFDALTALETLDALEALEAPEVREALEALQSLSFNPPFIEALKTLEAHKKEGAESAYEKATSEGEPSEVSEEASTTSDSEEIASEAAAESSSELGHVSELGEVESVRSCKEAAAAAPSAVDVTLTAQLSSKVWNTMKQALSSKTIKQAIQLCAQHPFICGKNDSTCRRMPEISMEFESDERVSITFTEEVEKLECNVEWDQLGGLPIVFKVVPKGAAERHGIQAGDRILQINETKTQGQSRKQLLPLLQQRPLTLELQRMSWMA